MALLDWIAADNELRLEGAAVRLRPHKASDFAEWAALREVSRDFLQPWEPTWPPDDLTRGAYRRRLAAYAQDTERGVAYPFLVFRRTDGALVGGITLSNIRRGVAQMGSIGYWIGQPFTRRGYTVDAVRAVTAFCFDRLRLHRVEAACIPTNTASQGVLDKAGFEREGLARDYLKIDGVWRDHLLFGLLSPNP
jgi:ribosomal-protein-alanine N-acetyltransferase